MQVEMYKNTQNPAKKIIINFKNLKNNRKMDELSVKVEVKGGNNDLPGDIRSRIASKLGGNIFLIEQVQLKVEALKNQVIIRSYKSIPLNRCEVHTGEGNVRGLKVNNELFFNGKNTKAAGTQNKSASNENGGSDKGYLIAFDENAARKESVEYNTIELARLENIRTSIDSVITNIKEAIDADGGVK
jgi:hypothetical protein